MAKKKPKRPVRLVLEASGKHPRELPATLFAAHCAILAQSGSGKSFLLGRLIEELVLSTRAKLLVLDPNSDFLRLNQANAKVWTDPKCEPWFFPSDRKDFKDDWEKKSIQIISNRNLVGLTPLRVDWGQLSHTEMAAVLNIDPRDDPELFACLTLAAEHAGDQWSDEDEATYDFPFYRERAEELVELLLTGQGPETLVGNTLVAALRSSGGQHLALRFRTHLDVLSDYEIWRHRGEEHPDLARITGEAWRVMVLDLQSLAAEEARLTIVIRALEAIWTVARNAWWEATRDPDTADHRVPIFIVIDEAHNLVPAQAATPALAHVAALLVRIAAEGRKYGLYLIVSTQRPRKIDSNILSECENLVLMRMKNETDVTYAREVLGYLEPDIAQKAKSLRKGDVLLRGNIGTTADTLHCAPRRTMQGGKDLSDYWTEL